MLHHGSVGQVQSKECYFRLIFTFLAFFVVFYQQICAFIIFISFLDEVANFRDRINQSKTGIGDKKLSAKLNVGTDFERAARASHVSHLV